jgi:hypothetical protein
MNQKHFLFSKLIQCGFICLSIGCDDLATSETIAPPIITISGLIEVPKGVDPPNGDLKVALVWYPDSVDLLKVDPTIKFPTILNNIEGWHKDYVGIVSQQVDVKPKFPARFQLEVIEPPPKEALRPRPDGLPGGWNAAILVLYRDGNHNGKLDMRTGDLATDDEVLGVSDNGTQSIFPDPSFSVTYTIYYSDAPLDKLELDAGFTLVRFEHTSDGCGGTIQNVDLDTEIPIPISNEPKVRTLNCKELRVLRNDSFVCPDSFSELPESEDPITFKPNESNGLNGNHIVTLVWNRNTCDGCTCTTDECEFTMERGQTPPVLWPCLGIEQ